MHTPSAHPFMSLIIGCLSCLVLVFAAGCSSGNSGDGSSPEAGGGTGSAPSTPPQGGTGEETVTGPWNVILAGAGATTQARTAVRIEFTGTPPGAGTYATRWEIWEIDPEAGIGNPAPSVIVHPDGLQSTHIAVPRNGRYGYRVTVTEYSAPGQVAREVVRNFELNVNAPVFTLSGTVYDDGSVGAEEGSEAFLHWRLKSEDQGRDDEQVVRSVTVNETGRFSFAGLIGNPEDFTVVLPPAGN